MIFSFLLDRQFSRVDFPSLHQSGGAPLEPLQMDRPGR